MTDPSDKCCPPERGTELPSSVALPSDLADQPPSDKLVYLVLAAEGPLRYSELQRRTQLADSTLTGALHRLVEDLVLVEKQPQPTTPRVVYFIIRR